MEADSAIRYHIWNSMLDADLNHRYFGRLASRYKASDRWAKVFVAITSSTAVSGWAVWGTPGLDWIWKVASAMATIVAIAMPVFDPAASMKIASLLTGRWFSILSDYELLWARVDRMSESEADQACQVIAEAEKPLAEQETSLAKLPRLIRHCEAEVRRSRGLLST